MGNRFNWLFIILFSTTSLYGQSLRTSLRKAKEAFYHKDYQTSFDQSQVALQKDSLIVDALFIAGESARQLRKFETAVRYLSSIPNTLKNGSYSSTDLYLGKCYKSLGYYKEAIISFQDCIAQQQSSNNLVALQAAEELEACQWAMSQNQKHNMMSVSEVEDDKKSNKTSEYAPVRYADKLYYSSALKLEKGEAAMARIFTRTSDHPARLFSDNPKRTDIHASNVALTPNAQQMYFTICRDEDYFAQERCEIWTMTKDYNGDWKAPSILPYPINARGFTTTQPSIGWDKSLRSFVLYFASDRPGGKGKLDIWGVTVGDNGEFGTPYLLPFNTVEDDATPYFHQSTQTLFFSSNGLPGLGGHDVFQTIRNIDGTWSSPENMGAPVNTGYDDLYYTWNMGSQRAYFSSNRSNRDCPDAYKGDFCTDIFEVEIFATLNLNVADAKTDSSIKEYHVVINSKKEEVFQQEFLTDGSSSQDIVLAIGKKYEVMVSAPGYIPHQFVFNATQFTKTERLVEKVLLRKQKVVSP